MYEARITSDTLSGWLVCIYQHGRYESIYEMTHSWRKARRKHRKLCKILLELNRMEAAK